MNDVCRVVLDCNILLQASTAVKSSRIKDRWQAMHRTVHKILTAISILFVVVVCAVWVRSYWVGDWFFHTRIDEVGEKSIRYTKQQAFIGFGEVGYQRSERVFPRALEERLSMHRADYGHRSASPQKPGRIIGGRTWAGFGFSSFSINNGSVVEFAAPLWLVAILFSVLPCLSVFQVHTRRRRRNAGLCVACGYDLRGSSDRCPECGEVSGGRG